MSFKFKIAGLLLTALYRLGTGVVERENRLHEVFLPILIIESFAELINNGL